MKHRFQVWCLLFLTVLLCVSFSCRSKKEGAGTGQVLAKVNDRVITPEDFVISIDLLYPPKDRPRYATPAGKSLFMQEMVIMELFYQEGIAQGIEQDPRFKQIIENYKRYLVYDTLMNRGINAASILDFYRANFVHVAIIFLKKPQNVTDKQKEEIRARALKLHDDIAKGANFADVAKRNSQHPSARNGGDVGAITRSPEWEPPMVDAALALTENDLLSTVIESPKGFYIVRLIEPGRKLTLDSMSQQVRRNIYTSLVNQNYATYAAQLQSQGHVEVNHEVLNSIKLDNLAGPEGGPIQPLVPEGIPSIDPMANPNP